MKKFTGVSRIIGLLILPLTMNATDFHVATNGSDSNPGTMEAPFRTIGKATSVMDSGDRCLIHSGTYRETIAPDEDNLYFGPYKDDRVEINGCDIVAGSWEKGEENILVTPMPEKVWQLFLDGREMNLARFPDAGDNSNPYTKNLFTNDKDRWAPTEILMPENPDENIVRFEKQEERHQYWAENIWREDWPENFWVGGVYSGWHGRNAFTSCTGTITASKGRILTVDSYAGFDWNRESTTRMGKGHGYIMNCLAALTSPMEWYWSEKDESLYFIPPEGFDKQITNVEVRHRLWGLDLRERMGIVVEGIHFKAASIRMDDAINCEIRKCEVLYPSPWSAYKTSDYGGRVDATCGVYVSGKNNYLWRNRIARSWGAGIRIEGSDNILEQCLIEDIDWLGRRMAAVQVWGLRNHVLRNVIRRCGNTGIDGGQKGFGVGRFGMESDIRYNLVLDIGYLASHDVGGFYVNTQGYPEPLKIVVAYNTFLSHGGESFLWITAGSIYIDNGSRGIMAYDNMTDLMVRHRGDVDILSRNNYNGIEGKNPLPTDEGIRQLLYDDSPCPPIDAAAIFDREFPNPQVGPPDARQRKFLTLDDRKEYSVEELERALDEFAGGNRRQ